MRVGDTYRSKMYPNDVWRLTLLTKDKFSWLWISGDNKGTSGTSSFGKHEEERLLELYTLDKENNIMRLLEAVDRNL